MQTLRSRFAELREPLEDAQALAEAERCLLCGDHYAPAPCILGCPTGIDVPGFIRSIAEGEVGKAADIILRENPLGGSCARVCPTPVLCEGACVLRHEGFRPVQIARLQRYATDRAPCAAGDAMAKSATRAGQVAVIGAGPGGLSCASVLSRLGFPVTVFDARPAVGGLVRYAIAPYRLWSEPLDDEGERLREQGVQFRLGENIASKRQLQGIEEEFDAVYLGIGLGADQPLDPAMHQLPGVHAALPWIEQLKAGHTPPVGERVAVIGGGNTAMDVAREALRCGAREVTILYRRGEAEMGAYPFEVEEARREGVRFLWLTVPIAFAGSHRLEGVKCRYTRLGAADASGRRRPEPVEGTDFLFPCDTAITALGQRPRQEFLAWIEGLEMRGGRIVADRGSGRTGNPRYFAGGDAVRGGATAVEAVADGKRAAHAIARYLEGVKR